MFRAAAYCSIEAEQVGDLHDDQVQDEDEDGGRHYCRVGCSSDAFCAFAGIVAFIAADDADGETEEEGFYEGGDDVAEAEIINYLSIEEVKAGCGADIDAYECAKQGDSV